MTFVISIGNELLHRLTSLKPQELRVDMERFSGEKAYAVYSSFSVGDEANKYQLLVNGYSGNAGNSYIECLNSEQSLISTQQIVQVIFNQKNVRFTMSIIFANHVHCRRRILIFGAKSLK